MEQLSSTEIQSIISNFDLHGRPGRIYPTGSGLINDTYRIENLSSGYPDYLLQRINHRIFKNVQALMENIAEVTFHLRKKLKDRQVEGVENKVLTLVPSKNGLYYCKDEFGNYWRMYLFIPDTRSYDLVETEQQAFEGGRAFGSFQSMLSDLDVSRISDSIPDFHNIEKRLKDLDLALLSDPAGRKKEVEEEIRFIDLRREIMCSILELGRKGRLPLRIIHSDTKFNNVLLDKNDHVQCVIDLDTVMPGFVAYDFGDAIRTIINTAAEDEKDAAKIQLNIPLFSAYASGYFLETKDFLTAEEVHSLMKGVILMPYMQAVRFLTDYVQGDIYYKTSFTGHNLQRTRAQITLVKRLEENRADLEKIITGEALKQNPSLLVNAQTA
ncbi:phosphotransferase enzyme family protein [Pararcticibacter amylolyticus]|uniref:Desulfatase n=1 Tax=Pararcticibacter amylolyticus TaxID=2173175 RepID=A0A2U2PF96_9SPHI|nr:aminoglycoside phosphotransferase family protein [Pararcticibacter amylolyticus]PWG79799.1 desulfatase [Pararcticibacter amylolyticus]